MDNSSAGDKVCASGATAQSDKQLFDENLPEKNVTPTYGYCAVGSKQSISNSELGQSTNNNNSAVSECDFEQNVHAVENVQFAKYEENDFGDKYNEHYSTVFSMSRVPTDPLLFVDRLANKIRLPNIISKTVPDKKCIRFRVNNRLYRQILSDMNIAIKNYSNLYGRQIELYEREINFVQSLDQRLRPRVSNQTQPNDECLNKTESILKLQICHVSDGDSSAAKNILSSIQDEKCIRILIDNFGQIEIDLNTAMRDDFYFGVRQDQQIQKYVSDINISQPNKSSDPNQECLNTASKLRQIGLIEVSESNLECSSKACQRNQECANEALQPTQECLNEISEAYQECPNAVTDPYGKYSNELSAPIQECFVESSSQPTEQFSHEATEPDQQCSNESSLPNQKYSNEALQPNQECSNDASQPTSKFSKESLVPIIESAINECSNEVTESNKECSYEASQLNQTSSNESLEPIQECLIESSLQLAQQCLREVNQEFSSEVPQPYHECSNEALIPNQKCLNEPFEPNNVCPKKSPEPNIVCSNETSEPHEEYSIQLSDTNTKYLIESSQLHQESSNDASEPNQKCSNESLLPNKECSYQLSDPNKECSVESSQLNQECSKEVTDSNKEFSYEGSELNQPSLHEATEANQECLKEASKPNQEFSNDLSEPNYESSNDISEPNHVWPNELSEPNQTCLTAASQQNLQFGPVFFGGLLTAKKGLLNIRSIFVPVERFIRSLIKRSKLEQIIIDQNKAQRASEECLDEELQLNRDLYTVNETQVSVLFTSRRPSLFTSLHRLQKNIFDGIATVSKFDSRQSQTVQLDASSTNSNIDPFTAANQLPKDSRTDKSNIGVPINRRNTYKRRPAGVRYVGYRRRQTDSYYHAYTPSVETCQRFNVRHPSTVTITHVNQLANTETLEIDIPNQNLDAACLLEQHRKCLPSAIRPSSCVDFRLPDYMTDDDKHYKLCVNYNIGLVSLDIPKSVQSEQKSYSESQQEDSNAAIREPLNARYTEFSLINQEWKQMSMKRFQYYSERKSDKFLGLDHVNYSLVQTIVDSLRIGKDDVLLTLTRVRLNMSIDLMAFYFGIDSQVIYNTFRRCTKSIATYFRNSGLMLPNEKVTSVVPILFQKLNLKFTYILSMVEVPYYRSEHLLFSKRYLAIFTPSGFVNFISHSSYEDNIPNAKLIGLSGITKILPPGALVLVDDRLCYEHACVESDIITVVLPQKYRNRISQYIIWLGKRFSEYLYLQPTASKRDDSIFDDVVTIVAGLINCQYNIDRSEQFFEALCSYRF